MSRRRSESMIGIMFLVGRRDGSGILEVDSGFWTVSTPYDTCTSFLSTICVVRRIGM